MVSGQEFQQQRAGQRRRRRVMYWVGKNHENGVARCMGYITRLSHDLLFVA